MIYDGIIPQIDDLILDKLPLMVEKRRMSRVFYDVPTRANVKELPPAKVWSKLPDEEEPIGWLPGDEIEPEEWEEMPIMMTMASSCNDMIDPARKADLTRLSNSGCFAVIGDGIVTLNEMLDTLTNADIIFLDYGIPSDSGTKFGEAGYGSNGQTEIRLNSRINWDNLANQEYKLANGEYITVDLLDTFRTAMSDFSLTNTKVMQLVLLHELAHFYGHGHGGSVIEINQHNKSIWYACK